MSSPARAEGYDIPAQQREDHDNNLYGSEDTWRVFPEFNVERHLEPWYT